MADDKIAGLKADLEARAADLQRAQKHLQKPSTLSFADRQDLSRKAGKAATELREHLAALDGKAEGDEGAAALITEAEAALGRAQDVLNKAGGKKGSHVTGAAERHKHGPSTRGAVGSAQQRGPDRIGGE